MSDILNSPVGSPAWCAATRLDIDELGFHHPDYLGTRSTLALIETIEALRAVAAADLRLIQELDATGSGDEPYDAGRFERAEAAFHAARAAAGLEPPDREWTPEAVEAASKAAAKLKEGNDG